ncbi:hypothetical protein COE51_22040 [Bacillus pseudomycoides]|nr:hypothetical protein COE51_22040 [Bacillus pseudomycoides]
MSANPFINKDLKEMEKIFNERVYTLNMLKHGRESKITMVVTCKRNLFKGTDKNSKGGELMEVLIKL